MARLVSIPWHRALEEPLRSSEVPSVSLLRLLKAPCPESYLLELSLAQAAWSATLLSCAKFGISAHSDVICWEEFEAR